MNKRIASADAEEWLGDWYVTVVRKRGLQHSHRSYKTTRKRIMQLVEAFKACGPAYLDDRSPAMRDPRRPA